MDQQEAEKKAEDKQLMQKALESIEMKEEENQWENITEIKNKGNDGRYKTLQRTDMPSKKAPDIPSDMAPKKRNDKEFEESDESE